MPFFTRVDGNVLSAADIGLFLPTFHAEDFGAVGNGVADNTTQIGNLLAAVDSAGGGVAMFGPGHFLADDGFTVPNNCIIRGQGESTILDFGGAAGSFSNGACLYAVGSVTGLPAVGADITEGDTTITFASAPSLSVGDELIIRDAANNSFSQYRTYYHQGQCFRVVDVTGSVVTVDQPSESDFLIAGSIEAHRLDPVLCGVHDMEIRGRDSTSSIAVISAVYGSRLAFSGLRLSGSQLALMQLSACTRSAVERCDFFDLGSNASLNYGLSIANCTDISVSRCTGHTTRHCLTMGGGSGTASIPNRDIRVSDCKFVGEEVAAADAHGNSERYRFENCFLYGGLNLGGDHSDVVGCHITNGNNSVGLNFSERVGMSARITSTTIEQTGPQNAATPVLIDMGTNNNTSSDYITRENGEVMFSGVTTLQTDGVRAINLRNRSSVGSLSARFVGCTFHRSDAVSSPDANAFAGVDSSGANAHWREVEFTNCKSYGVTLRADPSACEVFTAANNTIRYAGLYGVMYTDDGVAAASFPWGGADGRQRIRIEGNHIDGCEWSGVYVAGYDAATSIVNVSRNTLVRNGQIGAGNTFLRCAAWSVSDALELHTKDNIIGDDQAAPGAFQLWATSNVGTHKIRGTEVVGTLSGVTNGATTVAGPVTPQDFGARADGSSNDAVAIQAAIDAANCVHFPPASYFISSSLNVYDDTVLEGAGRRLSVITGNLTAPMIVSTDTAYDYALSGRILNVHISKLGFDNTSQANAGGVGIDMRQWSLSQVEDVDVRNCETGILLGNVCYHNRVESASASSCDTGFELENGANDNTLIDCRATNVTDGFWIHDGADYGISGGTLIAPKVETFTGRAVHFETANANVVSNFRVQYGRFENAPTSGVGVEYSPGGANEIVNCPTRDCDFIGLTSNFVDGSAVVDRNRGHFFDGGWHTLPVADESTGAAGWVEYSSTQNQFFLRNNTDTVPALLTAASISITGNNTYRINTPRAAFTGFTDLVAGDFALSGFGDTATVTAVDGGDCSFTLTVNASGTGFSSSNTLTLTFTNGGLPFAPVAVTTRSGGVQMGVPFSIVSASTTTLVLRFEGTPADGESYSLNCICIPTA